MRFEEIIEYIISHDGNCPVALGCAANTCPIYTYTEGDCDAADVLDIANEIIHGEIEMPPEPTFALAAADSEAVKQAQAVFARKGACPGKWLCRPDSCVIDKFLAGGACVPHAAMAIAKKILSEHGRLNKKTPTELFREQAEEIIKRKGACQVANCDTCFAKACNDGRIISCTRERVVSMAKDYLSGRIGAIKSIW